MTSAQQYPTKSLASRFTVMIIPCVYVLLFYIHLKHTSQKPVLPNHKLDTCLSSVEQDGQDQVTVVCVSHCHLLNSLHEANIQPSFCEPSAMATQLPVTGFRYGNVAKEDHRLQNPLNCFLLVYIFFCSKNSLIFEFKKPLPKGYRMDIKKLIIKRGLSEKKKMGVGKRMVLILKSNQFWG